MMAVEMVCQSKNVYDNGGVVIAVVNEKLRTTVKLIP